MKEFRERLAKLTKPDLESTILFCFGKMKDVPDYGAISELAYVLDFKSFLKICEYFGGATLTIPTVGEVETLIKGLLLYQYVDIEGVEYEKALRMVQVCGDLSEVKEAYFTIKNTLRDYELPHRTLK